MKQIGGIKIHSAANLFPLLTGAAFLELVADIEANGQREPITLYNGQLLDGRNRARACAKLKRDPKVRTWKGTDPFAYVVSLNLTRRHLSLSQRAMVAARLVETGHGGDRRSSGRSASRSQTEAAAELSISARVVRQARRVLEHADSELIAAVENDHVAVNMADQLVKRPVREQRSIARRATAGEPAAKVVREQNSRRRESKMREISRSNKAISATTRYGVILADPPWKYRDGTTTPNRRIDNHYPPMALEEICALGIENVGLDDSILFLCVPSPLLFEVVPPVLDAWGYNYKSQWIWHKTGKRGTGYWAIVEHEHILICPRGDVPCPHTRARFPSVFSVPVGEHSAKPVEIHERIEAMYPKASKIELFCRKRRSHWAAWGNESGA